MRLLKAKNMITISKHLSSYIRIAILVLALLFGIGTSLILANKKKDTLVELNKSADEIQNLKKTIATAQDDIAKKQSEINRLEND
jgi:peptidoglycan hydrolase CwlO-like protein